MPKSIADSVSEFSGVEPPVETYETSEDRKARFAEREKMQRELTALVGLQKSDGWALYAEQLNSTYEAAVLSALNETESTKLHRHAGAAYALRAQNAWLDSQIQGLVDALKS